MMCAHHNDPAMTRSAPAHEGPGTRATLPDVARAAGVGLATVDRVLNQRPGVHPRTIDRVMEAVRRLHYRPDPAAARLAQKQWHRIAWLLPSGTNSFVDLLRQHIDGNRAWMEDHRLHGTVARVDVFEPGTLAQAMRSAAEQVDTLVVMALDHPQVREAIDEIVAAGRTVITLVSDVPSSRRHHYVGIDNVAAGRTAARLMGRFLGARHGKVAVVAGSVALRDHAERCMGFGQIMASEFGAHALLPLLEGKDDSARTEGMVGKLLKSHPDLVGIYSAGAGNRGIAAALHAAGRAQDVVFVAHELTPAARSCLLDGTMDAVINQDAGHELRSALRLATARVTHEPVHADQERIRIDIYLKDNLP
jgi:LacI family transcriptional regulator